MKCADGGYESNLFQGTQCQRAVICAAVASAVVVGDAVFLRAGALSSFCGRDIFRCSKGVLLRAELLVPQPFAACGAVAVCEEFCCSRCCLCFSPLRRAVLLLLCSRSFAARGSACASARCGMRRCCCAQGVFLRALLLVIQHVAAGGAACFSARCRVHCRCFARSCFLQLQSEQRRNAKGARHGAQVATGAVVLFTCTKERRFIGIISAAASLYLPQSATMEFQVQRETCLCIA